jgi:hypothetical protein
VVVTEFATTTPHGAIKGKMRDHMVRRYNLDMSLAVGFFDETGKPPGVRLALRAGPAGRTGRR